MAILEYNSLYQMLNGPQPALQNLDISIRLVMKVHYRVVGVGEAVFYVLFSFNDLLNVPQHRNRGVR